MLAHFPARVVRLAASPGAARATHPHLILAPRPRLASSDIVASTAAAAAQVRQSLGTGDFEKTSKVRLAATFEELSDFARELRDYQKQQQEHIRSLRGARPAQDSLKWLDTSLLPCACGRGAQ